VDHDELRAVVTEICETEDAKGKLLKVAKWEMDAIIELFDPNNDGDIEYERAKRAKRSCSWERRVSPRSRSERKEVALGSEVAPDLAWER
jgi:hypothetical protein